MDKESFKKILFDRGYNFGVYMDVKYSSIGDYRLHLWGGHINVYDKSDNITRFEYSSYMDVLEFIGLKDVMRDINIDDILSDNK